MIITAMIDLIRAEYKYKIELHTHTSPGSKSSNIPARKMINMYADRGFSAVTITNHFKLEEKEPNETVKEYTDRFLADYYDACDEGKKRGVNILLGAEFTFADGDDDFLVFGITPDDLYNIENIDTKTAKGFYKEFRNDRNVIIQAHPFRDEGSYREGCSDGIEVYNMNTDSNQYPALAAKLASEKQLIKTIGSDTHDETQLGHCATLTKRIPKDSVELATIIKWSEYVCQIGDDILLPRIYRW